MRGTGCRSLAPLAGYWGNVTAHVSAGPKSRRFGHASAGSKTWPGPARRCLPRTGWATASRPPGADPACGRTARRGLLEPAVAGPSGPDAGLLREFRPFGPLITYIYIMDIHICIWCQHRRHPGRRSGHESSADGARCAAAERPCHDYAARGSANVRYEAVDSEEQRFGPARLGYYRAIRTGGQPVVPDYCWRRN